MAQWRSAGIGCPSGWMTFLTFDGEDGSSDCPIRSASRSSSHSDQALTWRSTRWSRQAPASWTPGRCHRSLSRFSLSRAALPLHQESLTTPTVAQGRTHRFRSSNGARPTLGRRTRVLGPRLMTPVTQDARHSSALMANASAKPAVVSTPTRRPPCSNASGIIVSASIVRIAPPAKARMNATVFPEAFSKNA